MESSEHNGVYLPTNLHKQADFWQGGFFHLVLCVYANQLCID